MLQEGKVIMLSNFAIGIKMGQYRAIRHRYNISFKEDTEVSLTEDGRIPLYGLSLIPFHELPSASKDEMFLVGMLNFIFQ